LLNLLLPKPELYDLSSDPDESYDVADLHSDVVRQTVDRIEVMMKTFPQNNNALESAQNKFMSGAHFLTRNPDNGSDILREGDERTDADFTLLIHFASGQLSRWPQLLTYS
jgi:hypothetical protein